MGHPLPKPNLPPPLTPSQISGASEVVASLKSWNVVSESDPHGDVASDSVSRGRAAMDAEMERVKRELGEIPQIEPRAKRSKSPSLTRLGRVPLGVGLGDVSTIAAPPLPTPPTPIASS